MTRDADLGRALVALARSAIGAKLGVAGRAPPGHAALSAPGATFVTLFRGENLRGCIGSLRALRTLRDDVCENALGAAFRDPRFPPLALNEFDSTSVEISLLSPSTSFRFASEEDLLARLRPEVDGVSLEYGAHRATFLPQVWATLSDPRAFLAELKLKAGLAADFWSAHLTVGLYQVTKWKESEFGSPRVLQ
jgi:AmmeMemoRadiSam system protein A